MHMLATMTTATNAQDEDRQCEGTLCHAGCCPMQGWYCCEGDDNGDHGGRKDDCDDNHHHCEDDNDDDHYGL